MNEIELAQQLQQRKLDEIEHATLARTAHKEIKALEEQLRIETVQREKQEKLAYQQQRKELPSTQNGGPYAEFSDYIKTLRDKGKDHFRNHEQRPLIYIPLHQNSFQWLWELLVPSNLEEFSELAFTIWHRSESEKPPWFRQAREFFKEHVNLQQSLYEYEVGSNLSAESWQKHFVKYFPSAHNMEWKILPIALNNAGSPINAWQAHLVLTMFAIIGYRTFLVQQELQLVAQNEEKIVLENSCIE